VNGVDLFQISTLLTDLEQQARGEEAVRDGDVSLFDVLRRLAERRKASARASSVRIDDGLHTYSIRAISSEGVGEENVVASAVPMKSPIRLISGLMEFGVAGCAPESLRCHAGPMPACGEGDGHTGRGCAGGTNCGPEECSVIVSRSFVVAAQDCYFSGRCVSTVLTRSFMRASFRVCGGNVARNRYRTGALRMRK